MPPRFLALVGLLAAMLIAPAPAHAEWHKAESERFVIYSDSRADDLENFGELLERYHAAIALETGRVVPVPSPSNRLTVYMVGKPRDLLDLYGKPNSWVAGFYIPRASGSVAFVPNLRFRAVAAANERTRNRRPWAIPEDELDPALSTLLHEYAHHFLISSARYEMPRWLAEGAAEYFSTAVFHKDGSVDLGLPNNDRAYEISQARSVPLIELLDYDLYLENRTDDYDAFYGRSWLLYHYLRFSKEREGQLVRYWQAVTAGMGSVDAAKAVFGDLDALDAEVTEYGLRTNLPGMRFSGKDIAIAPVKVSKLEKGHAAMMDVILQTKRGVDKDRAAELAEDGRAIAAKYPQSAPVWAALAEAEYDAGNDAEAILAADKAIALDPSLPGPYVQKGSALFRIARKATDIDAAYGAAMVPFSRLNALENDHPMPLIYYFRSYAERGMSLPEDARHALERAAQLAPFDKALWYNVAMMQIGEGKIALAKSSLRPVANDPHGEDNARRARDVIAVLENIPEGTKVSPREILASVEISRIEIPVAPAFGGSDGDDGAVEE